MYIASQLYIVARSDLRSSSANRSQSHLKHLSGHARRIAELATGRALDETAGHDRNTVQSVTEAPLIPWSWIGKSQCISLQQKNSRPFFSFFTHKVIGHWPILQHKTTNERHLAWCLATTNMLSKPEIFASMSLNYIGHCNSHNSFNFRFKIHCSSSIFKNRFLRHCSKATTQTGYLQPYTADHVRRWPRSITDLLYCCCNREVSTLYSLQR